MIIGNPGKRNRWRLKNNAGFFTDSEEKEDYLKFCELYLKAVESLDLIGVWFNIGEDYIIEQCAREAKIAKIRCLEPYFYENPWSAALAGKKVLVVSPFADLISEQYNDNRQRLFQNPRVLPDFDLKTITAVQTIGELRDERFPSWFAALDYMKNEVSKVDFDVALIGCGAYSLPLASYVKSIGKGAIHTGGTTQILFGIKGKRWDENPAISKFYNSNWVRPDLSDKQEKATTATGDYW